MFLPIPPEKTWKKNSVTTLQSGHFHLVRLSLQSDRSGCEWEEESAKLHQAICCYAATVTSSFLSWTSIFSKNQTLANLHNSCDFWDLIPERSLLLLEGSVSSPRGKAALARGWATDGLPDKKRDGGDKWGRADCEDTESFTRWHFYLPTVSVF